ncbi:uncharacterized protein LOC119961753 [Scyliorhinus canicula]|uniref:uncharacterized protein LOC119961753 n=1 Tax=Scyliorhinus canicula TaxID=7830 RepID=UPI0018F68CD6|nr:uncharacterized protein LOC119961753 [Scyliorhinus canicula]
MFPTAIRPPGARQRTISRSVPERYEQRALDLARGAASREVAPCQVGGEAPRPHEHRGGTARSPHRRTAPTSSGRSVNPDRREGPQAGGPSLEAGTPRPDAQRTDRDIIPSYESVTDREGAVSTDSEARRTSRHSKHGGTAPCIGHGLNAPGHSSTQETELGTDGDLAAAALLLTIPPNIADTLTPVGQVRGEASGTHTGAHHTVKPVQQVEVGEAEGLDGRRAGQAQHPAAAQTTPAFLAIPGPTHTPDAIGTPGTRRWDDGCLLATADATGGVHPRPRAGCVTWSILAEPMIDHDAFLQNGDKKITGKKTIAYGDVLSLQNTPQQTCFDVAQAMLTLGLEVNSL